MCYYEFYLISYVVNYLGANSLQGETTGFQRIIIIIYLPWQFVAVMP